MGDPVVSDQPAAIQSFDPVQRLVELRRYSLHPAKRDVLIDLFERELIEPQEASGMAVLGQFTDLDDPDSFAWLRGFSGMVARRRGLTQFYGGPVWRTHRDAANATMIDSDNVLLLQPARVDSPLRLPRDRPGHGATYQDRGVVVVGVHYFLTRRMLHAREVSRWKHAGSLPRSRDRCSRYVAYPAENDYPALPIRDDNVLVWLVGFPSLDLLEEQWDDVQRAHHLLGEKGAGSRPGELLRLVPTPRSLLKGRTESCLAAVRLSRPSVR